MTGTDKVVLQKILGHMTSASKFIAGYTIDAFVKDEKTITACAFVVSQIGEVVRLLSDETRQQYPNIPWKQMTGMRNKIVHNYEGIKLPVLWNTMTQDFPKLQQELHAIMKEITIDVKSVTPEKEQEFEP